ncbi:hypothetical protein L596_009990 [Steinernema carpocapsae]|uniref:Uncharacterized protein n=1 Tax=Steinernema carpocapsae TaxID=34508 RepID=A0A4U5PH90_STECR|nr:hypothetical protein L596_009990 [Steinernema carpocapsae]
MDSRSIDSKSSFSVRHLDSSERGLLCRLILPSSAGTREDPSDAVRLERDEEQGGRRPRGAPRRIFEPKLADPEGLVKKLVEKHLPPKSYSECKSSSSISTRITFESVTESEAPSLPL